jgi:hypothetical protein
MKATKKSFSEKSKKTKKRGPFLIPKPIPIPTENRNFSQKNDPDPDRLPKVNPAGL